jgi:hypothetical protein
MGHGSQSVLPRINDRGKSQIEQVVTFFVITQEKKESALLKEQYKV